MKLFADMHVHSKFSIDGTSTMEEYCLTAEKTGSSAYLMRSVGNNKDLDILIQTASSPEAITVVAPDLIKCFLDGNASAL